MEEEVTRDLAGFFDKFFDKFFDNVGSGKEIRGPYNYMLIITNYSYILLTYTYQSYRYISASKSPV